MFPRNSFAIAIPQFARLDEYAGVWAIEATAGGRLLDMFRSMDLRAHAAQFSAEPKSSELTQRFPARKGKTVAVIPLSGPLMKQRPSTGGTSTVQARRELRWAINDPNVSGVLLAIDSPGGTTAGTQALADEIRQANRVKPVWAQIEDAGYSAAYWLASQASQVFASNATTGVGSVGTYLAIRTADAEDGKTNASVRVFRSGPLKAAGEDGITDEQAAHLQGYVNDLQAHFTNAVRSGRGLGADVMAEITKGGVMLATEAKDKRLIDGIRPMDKTLAAMAAL